MKLEEEKKLVAEKLMGWRYKNLVIHSGKAWVDEDNIIRLFKRWSPQEERKPWDEILPKMRGIVFLEYINELIKLGLKTSKDFDTAKPSIRWKALIKTLTPQGE